MADAERLVGQTEAMAAAAAEVAESVAVNTAVVENAASAP
jgi:hypothetical protein